MAWDADSLKKMLIQRKRLALHVLVTFPGRVIMLGLSYRPLPLFIGSRTLNLIIDILNNTTLLIWAYLVSNIKKIQIGHTYLLLENKYLVIERNVF